MRERRRRLRMCGGPSSLRLTEAHRAAECREVCRVECLEECPVECREAWVECPTWETSEGHPHREEETTPDPRLMRWIRLNYAEIQFRFVIRMMHMNKSRLYHDYNAMT